MTIITSDNVPHRIEKSHPKYPKVLECFSLSKDDQEPAFLKILEEIALEEKRKNPTVNDIDNEKFQVIDNKVYFEGEELPQPLITKILSLIRDGLPLEHFENFWKRLRLNPSFTVIQSTGLYDFLEYKELPISEDGFLMAYRGVGADLWSISASKTTKVLQGQVNDYGAIYNGIGEVIEVERRGVSDDRNVHCHEGSLHIGSYDYARGWGSTVVLVKVDPKDIVSVPNDCSCQKCRVCKYEVVSLVKTELNNSVTDENGNGIDPEPWDGDDTDWEVEYDDFTLRVQGYLDRKSEEGFDEVTVRQIQCSFSPEWPSKEKVLNALQDLGYVWTECDGVSIVHI